MKLLIILLLIFSVQNVYLIKRKVDWTLDYNQFDTLNNKEEIYQDASIEDAQENEELDQTTGDEKQVEDGKTNDLTSILNHDSFNITSLIGENSKDSSINTTQNSLETSKALITQSSPINYTNSSFNKNFSQQLVLQLTKGLSNITRKNGKNVVLRCVFRCLKSQSLDSKCEIKHSNVRWLKNEAPLKDQKNKIEIHFVRLKNKFKDILLKLNIYNLDTHDKGFYKCELTYNRRKVESTGILRVYDQESDFQENTNSGTSSLNLDALRNGFVQGLDETNSLDSNQYGLGLSNADILQASSKNSFNVFNTMDFFNNRVEKCVVYHDELCSQYLHNQTVIVQVQESKLLLTQKLHNLLNLIAETRSLSFQCHRYAMSALCHYVYPMCDKQADIITKRQMCREDCELLEQNICKTEFELAKIQNLFVDGEGVLPNCNKLPIAGSKSSENCIHLGLPSVVPIVKEEESCYKDNGYLYRGKVSRSKSNLECEPWNIQTIVQTIDYPELLGGHNYCRNPDQSEQSPFCIIKIDSKLRKELCDVDNCGRHHLKLFIISPALIALIIFITTVFFVFVYRCYKQNLSKKNQKCIVVPEASFTSTNASYSLMSAHQQQLLNGLHSNNANLTNDLNLISAGKYGLGYSSSTIELNSLLSSTNGCQNDAHHPLNKFNNFNKYSKSNLGLFQNKKNLFNTKKSSSTTIKEYDLNSVLFLEELGEGAFGMVFKGQLNLANDLINKNDKSKLNSNSMLDEIDLSVIPIAIKTLKEDANHRVKVDFQREAELMTDLQHPNIVCLIGVCFHSHPMCMLFEFMSGGDLHRFLLNHGPVTNGFLSNNSNSNYSYPNNNLVYSNSNNSVSSYPSSTANSTQILDLNDFLHISIQIASGMEYLSSHHYVHRDLATRNCLVSDHLTVKIADFGLSRDIYSQDYYRVQSRSLLPVRWMPAESILYGRFSTESDVWSFAVLLWEIFTYGMQPYFGHNNQEVIEMIRLRTLLDCPENCPSNIYNLMLECWNEQPCKRPNFTEIHSRLRNLKAVYSNNYNTLLNNTKNFNYGLFDPKNSNNLHANEPKVFEQKSSNASNSNSCNNLNEDTSFKKSISFKKSKLSSDKLNMNSVTSRIKSNYTINNTDLFPNNHYQHPCSLKVIESKNLINSTGNLCISKSFNLNKLNYNLPNQTSHKLEVSSRSPSSNLIDCTKVENKNI